MSGIECDICPRHCKLHNGIGFCGDRIANLGKFSSISMDPIEKKPLYHVYPGSETLSLGSVGCNLNCPWCQNFQISKEYKNLKLTSLSVKELTQLAVNKKIKSVTFTYNEPSIAYEYIVSASEALKNEHVETFIVSSGYLSEKYLVPFYKNISAANIDLKCFKKETYKNIIGGDLNTILTTLEFLKNSPTWLEITTLLIPGLNDTTEEIDNMCNWIVDNLGNNIPIHFSAYFPTYKYQNQQCTSDKTVLKAVEIAQKQGIKYVYPGNIISGNSSTKCLKCNETIIERAGYQIKNHLVHGKCPHCKKTIPGLFK